MNRQIPLLVTLMLLVAVASCSHQPASPDPRDTVQVPEGYTGEDSIAYIEDAVIHSPISAEDLLGLFETHSVQNWLFNYNNLDRAKQDPTNARAYLANHHDSCSMRLANRFMRMYQLVTTNGDAMDLLQFALATNAALDTFRTQMPSVPPSAALGEIERVMDEFSSQTQLELNMQASVLSAIDDYCTLEAYRLWLSSVPQRLHSLAQEEYIAWRSLFEARFALWRDVSYRQERYSMKPMEIAGFYQHLLQNRRAELAQERSILLNGQTYKQQGRTVTTPQWEAWIAKNSVPEDIELLKKSGMQDCLPDPDTVKERVNSLRQAFARWLAARQALAAALPEGQATSYDNLTADIHSRIIGQLPLLTPRPED